MGKTMKTAGVSNQGSRQRGCESRAKNQRLGLGDKFTVPMFFLHAFFIITIFKKYRFGFNFS